MKKFLENITKHKINEANYFLSMMKETFEDDEVFHYNLSAFLSAARSITYYMQKQYSKQYGFRDWYANQKKEMENDFDLKYLNKARVEIIHKNPVGSLAVKEITVTVPLHGTIIDKEGNKSKEVFYGDRTPTHTEKLKNRLFSEHEEKDIIIFCENQLNKLTQIVEECEKQFG